MYEALLDIYNLKNRCSGIGTRGFKVRNNWPPYLLTYALSLLNFLQIIVSKQKNRRIEYKTSRLRTSVFRETK